MNNRDRFRKLLLKKKREAPEEYRKAEESGKLLEYLSAELKSLGIDPLSIDTSIIENASDHLNIISNILDECAFDPYFTSQAGDFERFISSKIVDFRLAENIEISLKFPKVAFAASAALISIFAMVCLVRKRLPAFLLCTAVASDCLRVSYNCYIKNYCSLAASRLMNNPGSSLLSWAQNALGLGKSNPLDKLKDTINWEVLVDNTIIGKIFPSVCKQYVDFAVYVLLTVSSLSAL
jgi:hypothetical protein